MNLFPDSDYDFWSVVLCFFLRGETPKVWTLCEFETLTWTKRLTAMYRSPRYYRQVLLVWFVGWVLQGERIGFLKKVAYTWPPLSWSQIPPSIMFGAKPSASALVIFCIYCRPFDFGIFFSAAITWLFGTSIFRTQLSICLAIQLPVY